ncbi:MAG: hypothetical protein ACREXK_12525 [Gammaproteobacteria bacterium]
MKQPRLEVLTDVPKDKVPELLEDFEATGAEDVKASRQADGSYRVEALFTEDSRYRASGVPSL